MSRILSIASRPSGVALALVFAFAAAPDHAGAQHAAYPDKAVHFIVGRPPGGVADIAARVLGQNLSERWRRQAVIENRPGGNGLVSFKATVSAPADGYTLLVAPDSDITINRFILKGWQSSYDSDILPVARLTTNPVVLVAHAKAPFSTVPELIAAAKAKPGSITFATAGVASAPHLAGEFFAERAGIELRHIPYKGGAPAATAAAGGHVDLAVLAVSSAVPLVKSGAIKVIGVSAASRLPSEPDWPIIAEGGLPGFEASIWTGLFAKAGTPPAILDALEKQVKELLADPAVVRQFDTVGAQVAPLFGSELKTVITQDIERNRVLVNRLGLALD